MRPTIDLAITDAIETLFYELEEVRDYGRTEIEEALSGQAPLIEQWKEYVRPDDWTDYAYETQRDLEILG